MIGVVRLRNRYRPTRSSKYLNEVFRLGAVSTACTLSNGLWEEFKKVSRTASRETLGSNNHVHVYVSFDQVTLLAAHLKQN